MGWTDSKNSRGKWSAFSSCNFTSFDFQKQQISFQVMLVLCQLHSSCSCADITNQLQERDCSLHCSYLIKGMLSNELSFLAYTYAGEPPSCSFGFNSHGLVKVFSFNKNLNETDGLYLIWYSKQSEKRNLNHILYLTPHTLFFFFFKLKKRKEKNLHLSNTQSLFWF